MTHPKTNAISEKKRRKFNYAFAAAAAVSLLIYLHFLVIICVELPATFDPWVIWEEATEDGDLGVLPELDESISEDNGNTLKWFNRAQGEESRRVVSVRSKGAARSTEAKSTPITVLFYETVQEELGECAANCTFVSGRNLLHLADVVVFDAAVIKRIPMKA